MESMLVHLRDALGLELLEKSEAWTLLVRKPGGLVFQVTVAQSVLEWFVAAHDDAGAIWSDWVDHYAIESETREELLTEMASSIESFVTILAQAECRVVHSNAESTRIIELKVGSSWNRLSVAWMT